MDKKSSDDSDNLSELYESGRHCKVEWPVGSIPWLINATLQVRGLHPSQRANIDYVNIIKK